MNKQTLFKHLPQWFFFVVFISMQSINAVDFNPVINGDYGYEPYAIYSAVVQPDEKIIVVGDFTTVSGQNRNCIARFYKDGSLDSSFNPGVNGLPYQVVLQDDGKILIAGLFTTVGGVNRNNIARLNSDGTLDTAFAPTVNSDVNVMALQADGKIVIGGSFSSVNGTTRNRIARLNSDGTLDSSYDPDANNWVSTILIMPDGKMIVSGNFTSIDSTACSYTARLNSDGTIDNTYTAVCTAPIDAAAHNPDGGGRVTLGEFAPYPKFYALNGDGSLYTYFDTSNLFPDPPEINPFYAQGLTVQSNGYIFYCGDYPDTLDYNWLSLARFRMDGSIDPDFQYYTNVNTYNEAWIGCTLQKDGGIILYGIENQYPSKIAGFSNNQPATERLQITDSSTRIEWERGGGGPRGVSATFELSTDAGSTWTYLGAANNQLGDDIWQLDGLSLPSSGLIRARAANLCGFRGMSRGIIETVAPIQNGVLLLGKGIAITNGDTTPSNSDDTNFGVLVTSNAIWSWDEESTKSFEIKNLGITPLTVSDIFVDGPHSTDFTIEGISLPLSLDGLQSVSFNVKFNPTISSTRIATVNITSDNAGDDSHYFFTVEGEGSEPVINITGNGTTIPEGSMTPSVVTATDFRLVDIASGQAVSTYTIQNTGTAPLHITGINKDGAHASDFTIGGGISSIIEPGAYATFPVTFNPSGMGVRTASIILSSNAANAATYDFVVQGIGAMSYTSASDIPITSNGVTLSGGDAPFILNYPPEVGTQLTVINNTGLSFISGEYSNLAHGDVVVLGYNGQAYYFVVNYYGGDGNDLVLQWADAELYSWGTAASGRLGNNTTTPNQKIPVLVTNSGVLAGKQILKIASGGMHTLALLSNGDVVAWGDDASGQLGNDAAKVDSKVPVLVDNFSSGSALTGKIVVAIAAGYNFSLALCSDNTLVAWGENTSGQLGNNTATDSPLPILVSASSSSPASAIAGKKVVRIASGPTAYHSMALCTDNITGDVSLVAWGRNSIKCLGNNSTATNFKYPVPVTVTGALVGKQVVGMSAGLNFSVVLCSDSSIAAWGENASGRLGNGLTTDSATPVSTLISSLLTGGKSITAISAGASHVIALRSDGDAITWGDNTTYGKLGINSTADSTSPTLVFTAANLSTSALSGDDVAAVCSGENHTYALRKDGFMTSWGHNSTGQLGLDTTALQKFPNLVLNGAIPTGRKALAMTSGLDHGVALVTGVGTVDRDNDGLPDGWEVQMGLNPLLSDQNSNSVSDNQDDFDGDGLTNLEEYQAGTDPLNADTDGDNLPDDWEIQKGFNPLLSDQNSNSVSDDQDDFDSDTLTNLQEFQAGTDPFNADTDGDNLPDGWEVQKGLNPLLSDQDSNSVSDDQDDFDSDTLTNLQEFQAGTDPLNADTDGDNLPDDWEIQNSFLPLRSDHNLNGVRDDLDDFDEDGLTNFQEYQAGTDPLVEDTDRDNLPDAWEVQNGLNPILSDQDNDGVRDDLDNFDSDILTNIQEYLMGTDPLNEDPDDDGDGLPTVWETLRSLNPANGDQDGNGISDGADDFDGDKLTNLEELQLGTDPLNADSDNDGLPDGWEYFHGLNALVSTGNDGAGGDPDNDGITNEQALAQNVHPYPIKFWIEQRYVSAVYGMSQYLTEVDCSDFYKIPTEYVGSKNPTEIQDIYNGIVNNLQSTEGWLETPISSLIVSGGKRPLYYEYEGSVSLEGSSCSWKQLRLQSNRIPSPEDTIPDIVMLRYDTSTGNNVFLDSIPLTLGLGIITLTADWGAISEIEANGNERLIEHTADTKKIAIIELKVTDFSTKSDAVPYTAITNAIPPKNSELCLKADKTDEKAKIEIDIPDFYDAKLLSELKWKVIQKPSDTMVSEGGFDGINPPTVELSLDDGSTIEDEILFEVQVGADGTSFTPAAKMNVRVVRDRLNWWFEPFSANLEWRTAKPEPRKDTEDYITKQITNAKGNLEWVPDPTHPDHKPTEYKRESLQSVYEFFKSTTAIGPVTPKENWLKPTITCFGEFHDALKAVNGNNPLVDLNSLERIDMTAVTELPSFAPKYLALRSTKAKQTTYASDENPTYMATLFPERVQWVTAVASSIASANLSRGTLLSIWQREGSLSLNTQSSTTTNFDANLAASQLGAIAPSSSDEAKVCYIFDATYQCFGSDFLIPTYRIGGTGDNIPDLRDYAAALSHIRFKADQVGGAGSGDKLFNALTGTSSVGGFVVSVNAQTFYEELLRLVGLYYLSGWQPEGPDISYMVYNMGLASFNGMKATLGGSTYPERSRLGLADWAINYEIRTDEYHGSRDHAQKFHVYRMAFEVLYP